MLNFLLLNETWGFIISLFSFIIKILWSIRQGQCHCLLEEILIYSEEC